MQFDEYQEVAKSTAIYPESGKGTFNAVSYAILGLSNEAGEVAGKLKKVWRDNEGVLDEGKKADIAKELGDVLWYLSAVAEEIGYGLNDIAKANLHKLLSRQERGVIGGSGDNR